MVLCSISYTFEEYTREYTKTRTVIQYLAIVFSSCFYLFIFFGGWGVSFAVICAMYVME